MSTLHERVFAEVENIQSTLSLIPSRPIESLSALELAGIGSILHSFYNGIENILKQIYKNSHQSLPTGQNWHKDLLLGVPLSQELLRELTPFLAFRHFFNHAYALDLDYQKLIPLIESSMTIFKIFCQEVFQLIEEK